MIGLTIKIKTLELSLECKWLGSSEFIVIISYVKLAEIKATTIRTQVFSKYFMHLWFWFKIVIKVLGLFVVEEISERQPAHIKKQNWKTKYKP